MSRLIDADALLITVIKIINNSVGAECDGLYQCLDAINNAPTVERKPFASVTFNKDELEQIVRDRVIEPIKNGELVVKTEERPQDEIIKELWNCRNELCLKCERYKEAWNGACEDCRYNFSNMEKWKEGSDEVADDKHL